jgi:hypothetical protein
MTRQSGDKLRLVAECERAGVSASGEQGGQLDVPRPVRYLFNGTALFAVARAPRCNRSILSPNSGDGLRFLDSHW